MAAEAQVIDEIIIYGYNTGAPFIPDWQIRQLEEKMAKATAKYAKLTGRLASRWLPGLGTALAVADIAILAAAVWENVQADYPDKSPAELVDEVTAALVPLVVAATTKPIVTSPTTPPVVTDPTGDIAVPVEGAISVPAYLEEVVVTAQDLSGGTMIITDASYAPDLTGILDGTDISFQIMESVTVDYLENEVGPSLPVQLTTPVISVAPGTHPFPIEEVGPNVTETPSEVIEPPSTDLPIPPTTGGITTETPAVPGAGGITTTLPPEALPEVGPGITIPVNPIDTPAIPATTVTTAPVVDSGLATSIVSDVTSNAYSNVIAEASTLRKDQKHMAQLTYMAMLRFMNRTWGKISELLDFYEALKWNLSIGKEGERLLLTFSDGKQIVVFGEQKIGEFPVRIQAKLIKAIHDGKVPNELWDLDQPGIATDLFVMEMTDQAIGQIKTWETNAVLASDNYWLKNALGNPSTWISRAQKAGMLNLGIGG